MEHNLQHTISLLTRTPAALNALLRDLPETWTFRNEGENTWSAFDVLGHLIHGERTDWMPRAKIILQFGETRAFDPFDRFAQRTESQGKSLGQLLDEFASLRAASLDELRALKLTPEDLRRRGRHPCRRARACAVPASLLHHMPRSIAPAKESFLRPCGWTPTRRF